MVCCCATICLCCRPAFMALLTPLATTVAVPATTAVRATVLRMPGSRRGATTIGLRLIMGNYSGNRGLARLSCGQAGLQHFFHDFGRDKALGRILALGA